MKMLFVALIVSGVAMNSYADPSAPKAYTGPSVPDAQSTIETPIYIMGIHCGKTITYVSKYIDGNNTCYITTTVQQLTCRDVQSTFGLTGTTPAISCVKQ